jgi:hypothetical protein
MRCFHEIYATKSTVIACGVASLSGHVDSIPSTGGTLPMTTRSLRRLTSLAGLLVLGVLVLSTPSAAWATSTVPVVRQSYSGDLSTSTIPPDPGVTAAMDTEVTSPAINDLPLSVHPGDTFAVNVDTAPSAHCAGSITFRGVPPMALPDMVAAGEICSWSVTVPTTAQPGTAIVAAQVARGGQSANVAGVVYVNPFGESR